MVIVLPEIIFTQLRLVNLHSEVRYAQNVQIFEDFIVTNHVKVQTTFFYSLDYYLDT